MIISWAKVDSQAAKEMLRRKKKVTGKGEQVTISPSPGIKIRTDAEKALISHGKQAITSLTPAVQKPLPVDDSGVTTAGTSPPPSQENKRVSLTQGSPAVDRPVVNAETEAQRLQDEADARLQEQGLMPFMKDMEACPRVGTSGLALFRRDAAEYPAQLARTLRGKIASIISKTYRFASRIEKVHAELNSERDTRYIDLSSENREPKEKVEKLQGIHEELIKVSQQISEQTKQLADLLKAKAEAERARKAEEELRKERFKLKKEIEQLAKEKTEAEMRAATVGAAASQQAVDMTAALAP